MESPENPGRFSQRPTTVSVRGSGLQKLNADVVYAPSESADAGGPGRIFLRDRRPRKGEALKHLVEPGPRELPLAPTESGACIRRRCLVFHEETTLVSGCTTSFMSGGSLTGPEFHARQEVPVVALV